MKRYGRIRKAFFKHLEQDNPVGKERKWPIVRLKFWADDKLQWQATLRPDELPMEVWWGEWMERWRARRNSTVFCWLRRGLQTARHSNKEPGQVPIWRSQCMLGALRESSRVCCRSWVAWVAPSDASCRSGTRSSTWWQPGRPSACRSSQNQSTLRGWSACRWRP